MTVKLFQIVLYLSNEPTLQQATQQASHYRFEVFCTRTKTYLLDQRTVLIFQVVYPPKKLGNAGYVSLSWKALFDLLLMLLVFFQFPFCQASVLLSLLITVKQLPIKS